MPFDLTSKSNIATTFPPNYSVHMRKSLTLRLDWAEHHALENLSKLLKQPMNKLIVKAIKDFLMKRGQEEIELKARLDKLSQYRRGDPDYERAIEAFVEDEVSNEDPLEEKLFIERLRSSHTGDNPGPVQTKLRSILNG